MAALREQVVCFIAALRSAGVRISVAESIDAMNAVAAAGIERARMHEALAAALIKDEADRAIFDESFSRFFAAPARARSDHPDQQGAALSAASGRGRPGENPLPRDDSDTPPRKSDQPHEGAVSERDDSQVPRHSASENKSPPVNRKNIEPGKDSERTESATQSETDRKRERREHGKSEELAESEKRGIDAAPVARVRAIATITLEKFSDLDYDESS